MHVSFDDVRVVRDNLAGSARTTRIPNCLFTDAELAHVAISDREAKSQGLRYRTLKLPMAAIMRICTHSDNRGVINVLIVDDDLNPGLHSIGYGSERIDGGGASCRGRPLVLHGLSRRHLCTRHDSRRADSAILGGAGRT
jgi:pyruvate/2-oxoglutarate dehydrogenase complex dihydrolipoamide dehydrogenase (E3) component